MLIGGAVAVMTATHQHATPGPAATGTVTTVQPEAWTTSLAATMDSNDSYRDPSQQERDTATTALGRLLVAGSSAPGGSSAPAAVEGLRSVGFATGQGTDPDTGRPLVGAICRSETCPGWGVLLVDTSAPIRLAIEVPHPKADLNTESLGLDLFRRVPGAVLIMAGAYRRAADGSADVAHNASSMFNAFAGVFATRDIPQVQLHGFADESLPGTDVVVSTGQSSSSHLAERVVAAAVSGGLRACRAWQGSCGRLEGTTNVQGSRAAEAGSAFLHVETNYTIRGSASRRKALIDDLVAGDLTDRG